MKTYNVGICALTESWAFHYSNYLLLEDYDSRWSSAVPELTSSEFENFLPYNRSSSLPLYVGQTWWGGWIPAGVYNDLMDNTVNEYIGGTQDGVSGFTNMSLFSHLTSSVKSPQEYRNVLMYNYPAISQDIEDLFDAYNWE